MFKNTFDNDPDLRVTVKLSNYLFLTTTCWSNPDDVGISTVPTFNGKAVVSSTKLLNSFTSYMNAISSTFKFDHAVGLIKYFKSIVTIFN